MADIKKLRRSIDTIPSVKKIEDDSDKNSVNNFTMQVTEVEKRAKISANKKNISNPNHDTKNKAYAKITISLTERQKAELASYASKLGKGMSFIIKNTLEEAGIISRYNENKLMISVDDEQLEHINQYCSENDIDSSLLINRLLKEHKII